MTSELHPASQVMEDLNDMIYALIFLDWTVEKRSLYDEEGIEGWAWVEPDGTEHVEIGNWLESPPWPASARQSVAKARQR